MAGLYSALLLISNGVSVHVFEANEKRLGGRIHTHRFTSEKNQYFEAGAMRIPSVPVQRPVFDLIDYLNENVRFEHRIELIKYVMYDTGGNRVFVNGRRRGDGSVMTLDYATDHPDELGFQIPPESSGRSADELLAAALRPMHELLSLDFERGFQHLLKYDDFSLRSYLKQVVGWPDETIDYAEVMSSQTNQFHHNVIELAIQTLDFSTAEWKTVADGMDRLPNACAELIGRQRISLGVEVTEIDETSDGKIAIVHTASSRPEIFDKVIIALPPPALRMMRVPHWGAVKKHAIRALNFEPLYKMGLRFRSRFWEHVRNPSYGGQSITDLPSRWAVYPSYGIGDPGPGVLLLYSWATDAASWLPQSEEQRVRLALRDLDTLYSDEVDVRDQFLEAHSVAWQVERATGDAAFLPGQFRKLFRAAQSPEGNIFFAGEHLSMHHTWILGALDSGLTACRQLLRSSNLLPLRPGYAPLQISR